ncbi:MAG: hypothetical protein EHM89_20210 [Acidobacteria bacterium]|nr:MAG: hypothetical protein EHM89_20210 [Acidobacteriota bacterium]
MFLRDLDRIKVGMADADVRRILGRYMEGTGWPSVPPGVFPVQPKATDSQSRMLTADGTHYPIASSPTGEMVVRDSLVFRHSNESYYNSDFGIVTFWAGRVVGVHFSPD